MNGKKIEAKYLREKATIKEIEKKRGYYKWWADKNALEVLLNKLGLMMSNWMLYKGMHVI